PLLDNISISGASGVLVNITGGADLTLGEVHQINEIIHDAVGDDAETIFGAVHEPAMQGEIRVTVIATGFDRSLASGGMAEPPSRVMMPTTPVLPFPAQRQRQPVVPPRAAPPVERRASQPGTPSDKTSQDLSDMEIPTFIRRQMD
ncbi:MAG TPA: cell division protein FtsZ, partial [Gemmatimonadaceae bacterium]